MNTRILLAALLLCAPEALAQQRAGGIDFGGGVGIGGRWGTFSLAGTRQVPVFGGRLMLGGGVRYTGFIGRDQQFKTADRDQLDGGPQDRVRVASPRLHAFNLAVHAAVEPVDRLVLGFNIDVLGVTLGPERDLEARSPGTETRRGSPTGFNLLQGGNADRGSLNSEFYLGFRLSRRVLIRAGFSHVVTEYSVDQPFTGGSDRVRAFGNLGFLGVAWRL